MRALESDGQKKKSHFVQSLACCSTPVWMPPDDPLYKAGYGPA